MMLSGLIEFGFMLNYYLDVIDAARESARFAADGDPIRDPAGNPLDPNPVYYTNVQELAKQSLLFSSDGRIDWILKPCSDGLPPHDPDIEILGDVVISVPIAEWQASTYGHTLEVEMSLLVAHGVLHLLGYEHEEEHDMLIMQQKEKEILRSLGCDLTESGSTGQLVY